MSRQQELARKLASYKGHLYGRIGPVEHSVCHQLIERQTQSHRPAANGRFGQGGLSQPVWPQKLLDGQDSASAQAGSLDVSPNTQSL